VVVSRPADIFGYFAWPSVTRTPDGELVVACSGLRMAHVCPFGKTVLFRSKDNGKTWSEPTIVNDTTLDDRDAGVISLGGKSLLVSWFTLDIRSYVNYWQENYDGDLVESWKNVTECWTEEQVRELAGSWIRTSSDGRHWNKPVRVSVSTPHGPIRLKNGDLFYLGKEFGLVGFDAENSPIRAIRSSDGGQSWQNLGAVPNADRTENKNYHEPHVVELPSGKLIGLIRYERDIAGYPDFSLFQTESNDGGVTWSQARSLGISGSPPHVFRHSSGAIVCVYGYRKTPFGQRVMISSDEDKTWKSDLILRDDGPESDLGYPASVELPDGRIFTVYYQKTKPGEKCSILWSCWELPC
jgi:hypothetical protein